MFVNTLPQPSRRATGATFASVVFHGLLFALVVALFAVAPERLVPSAPLQLPELLFLEQAGSGGGGGGSPAPAPPKPTTIPRSTPPEPVPLRSQIPPPLPTPQFVTSVMTPSATIAQATGANSVSLPQYGGGGRDRGIGPDAGDGVGPGGPNGFGGDVPGPGNRITTPTIIRSPSPTYTSEAMRAKVTGIVLLEAIVQADGTVGEVRVVRSLDRGLDQEAMRAAKLWLFTAARDREGRQVAVRVQLELSFRLH